MARPVAVLEKFREEREESERRVRASTTSQRDWLRARIVPLRHQGLSQRVVAERLGVSVRFVSRCSRRLDAKGIAGLHYLPGRGPRPISVKIPIGSASAHAARGVTSNSC